MPWHVARSSRCPASKPFAVIKDSDNSIAGCHATEEMAKRQLSALYAQEGHPNMQRKTFDLIETKAEGEDGWFSALASVFGNVDHVGDRVMPGAFKNTLKKWRESGRPLPVILSHQWENPFATVGKADPRAVMETDQGLLVQGQLDLDNDLARQVHKLMKQGLMTGWSFGYTVPDDGERLGEDGANEITEIDLVEVGPTLKGANPDAQLQAVKSALDVEAPPEPKGAKTGTAFVAIDGTTSQWQAMQPTAGTDATVTISTATPDEEPPAEVPSEEKSEEVEEPKERSLPLTAEELEKAIAESDELQAWVTAEVERRLAEKAEPPPEPVPDPIEETIESLHQEEIKTVESEKPESPPVKPAANDPLKDEIDRLRLEIAVGKRL